MQHHVMRCVYAADRLVRFHARPLDLMSHADNHRPFETDREHRMCDESRSVARVYVAGKQIVERRGIRHRPARGHFGYGRIRAVADQRRWNWHAMSIYARIIGSSTLDPGVDG